MSVRGRGHSQIHLVSHGIRFDAARECHCCRATGVLPTELDESTSGLMREARGMRRSAEPRTRSAEGFRGPPGDGVSTGPSTSEAATRPTVDSEIGEVFAAKRGAGSAPVTGLGRGEAASSDHSIDTGLSGHLLLYGHYAAIWPLPALSKPISWFFPHAMMPHMSFELLRRGSAWQDLGTAHGGH